MLEKYPLEHPAEAVAHQCLALQQQICPRPILCNEEYLTAVENN